MALALTLCLFAVLPVLAQPFGGPPDPEQMRARLAEETDALVALLKLTEAQEVQVRSLLDDRNEKRVALFEKAREQRSREAFRALRADVAALDEETDRQLAEVLTDDQMATYEKRQEEQAAERRGRRRGRRGGS